jgi:hypothetical protein
LAAPEFVSAQFSHSSSTCLGTTYLPRVTDRLLRVLALNAAGWPCSSRRRRSEEFANKIGRLMHGEDGMFRRNTLRMQRGSRLCTAGARPAAGLIEEFLYDHELRFEFFRDNKQWWRWGEGEERAQEEAAPRLQA